MNNGVLITREFAEHYFPEFVSLVQKNLDEANTFTKHFADNVKKPTPPKPTQDEYVRPRDRTTIERHTYDAQNPKVHEAATMKNDGVPNWLIAKEMGLKLSTVNNYLTVARAVGLIKAKATV